MNILIVTSEFPYPEVPHAGGMTIFKMIESLSERHNIYLISTITREEETHLQEIAKYCKGINTFKVFHKDGILWRLLIKYLKFNRFHKLYIYLRYISASIKEIINKHEIDIIQVEYPVLAYFVSRSMSKAVPYIVDPHDVILRIFWRKVLISRGLAKLLWRLVFELVKKWELYTYKHYQIVLTRSQAEKNTLLNHDPSINVSLLSPYVRKPKRIANNIRNPHSILFVGAMNREVNREAVRYFYHEVFSRIRLKIPVAQFIVVGNAPPEDLKMLAEKDPSIKVTGWVEDIVPYYYSASLFVAPLLSSGGIIVKILDSMACGLPVVATPIANDGIEASDNKEILLAGTASEFTEKVISVLEDKNLWKTLSEEGERFVLRKYNWKDTISCLEENYKKAVVNFHDS